MVESANTTQEIKEIKETLGQEVVPSVTGKPSRILKEQKPKKPIKKVTAGGASLFEIAAAIQSDPTITIGQAIKQGKQESKEREKVHSGGALRKGTKNFFKGALGQGLGGAVASLFDTPEQKEGKKLSEIERQYEEGNKFKADFLKSLLGEKVGGMIAQGTTLTSTKVSAFEKYQEFMRQHMPPEQPKKPKKVTVKRVKPPPKATTPKPVKPKSSPQREEAHKALMALGYKKEEATERLAHAPENASVEDLIRHGLNPSVKQISKPEAASKVEAQAADVAKKEVATSPQAEAAATGRAEDTAHAIKQQEEHNKRVEKDLKEIKDKLDHMKSGGLLDMLLGKLKNLFAGPLGILQKVGPFLLRLFAKGGMVALAGVIGYQVGKWLDNKFHISEHINNAIDKTKSWVESSFRHIKNKLTGAITTRDEAIKKGVLSYYDDNGFPQFLNKNDVAKSEKLTGKTWLDMDRGAVYEKNPQLLSRGTIQRPSAGQPEKKITPVHIPTKPAVKQPPITAPMVSRAFAQKKELAENNSSDMNSALAGAVASVVQSGTAATVSAVEGVKKILPAIAKSNSSDPGGVIVKVRNSESSQAAYVAQIFEHPATYGGLGNM